MRWHLSHKYDPVARVVADRHYNRRKIGSPQFAPPGRCLVLRTHDAGALWITSWPFAEYVKHEWPGAWVNSAFRNERRDLYLSSELIREAIAATRWFAMTEPSWRVEAEPDFGMISFVDPKKVKHKRDPGRCFIKAGFVEVGLTKKHNLIAFQMTPDAMPAPAAPIGAQALLAMVR